MRIFLIVLYLKQNVHEQVRSGDVKLGSLKIKPALLHLLSMCVMEVYCIHKANTDLYYTNIIPKEISNKFFVSPCIINVAFALICILPHFHRKRFLSRLTTVRGHAQKPPFRDTDIYLELVMVLIFSNLNVITGEQSLPKESSFCFVVSIDNVSCIQSNSTLPFVCPHFPGIIENELIYY